MGQSTQTGIPEGEEKEKGIENIFAGVTMSVFLFTKLGDLRGRSEVPTTPEMCWQIPNLIETL